MPLILQGQSQLSSVGLPSMLAVHTVKETRLPTGCKHANKHLGTPHHFKDSPYPHSC